jgi:hypothetical protein
MKIGLRRKKMNKSAIKTGFFFALFGPLFLFAEPPILQELMKQPAHVLSNFDYDPGRPLMERVGDAPDFVITYLRNMDGKTDYRPYRLTSQERALLSNNLTLLPARMRSVFEGSLVAIYFIENFTGSGMADYVLDRKGRLKTVLYINPATMKNDISKWLTFKENSCFSPDAKASVRVWCGTNHTGLLYILLHEGTHIVDYVDAVTPFVEKSLIGIGRQGKGAGAFIKGVWKNYKTPLKKYDYPGRTEVDFYGLAGGPHLALTNAASLYWSVEKTPFASIYGSMNWAEDLAEFVTFYHLVEVLGLPYEIKFYRKGLLVQSHSFRPWNSWRKKWINAFYRGSR